MTTVSVIILSVDKFADLLKTISSVKKQTYPIHEIIVIDQGSTQHEYHKYDWEGIGVKMVHLPSSVLCNSTGFIRNKGIMMATGKYVAFCDDTCIWFPNKIQQQIECMNKENCKMSCTDSLCENKEYNATVRYNVLKEKYKTYMDNGFPKVITHSILKLGNCIICNSVLVDIELLKAVKGFKNLKDQEYVCWLELLENTNCAYVEEACMSSKL